MDCEVSPEGPGAEARLAAGERVELKKPHACGGSSWTVTRIGADIGLICDTCGRRLLIARDQFNKQLKRRLGTVVPTPPAGTGL